MTDDEARAEIRRKIIERLSRAVADNPFAPLKFEDIVKCRACGQKNRKIIGRRDARCGKCGLPL